jgi:hypothetical protein
VVEFKTSWKIGGSNEARIRTVARHPD